MRSNGRSICHFGMMVLATIIVMGFCAHAQTPLPSPTPAAPATPGNKHGFFRNIARDQKAIWTLPFHLHRGDVGWGAPLLLSTAALIATDRKTGDELAESTGQLKTSRVISYAGSDYSVAAVAAGFYLFGRMNHNDRARETGILGAEALIDSTIVVTAFKEMTQRRRPLAVRGRGDFFKGGTSFPSGHSIKAWALATVIANEYHDRRTVQIAAYAIATAVSISRFTGEKHYLSDILVGSAMGYGIGRYVYHAHHRTASGPNGEEEEESFGGARHWPAVAPVYDRHARSYGVALAWSF